MKTDKIFWLGITSIILGAALMGYGLYWSGHNNGFKAGGTDTGFKSYNADSVFIFKNGIKKTIHLSIPAKEKLEGYESWVVRWQGRTGDYIIDVKPEAEFFTSEEDAKIFEQALRDAFKLTRVKYSQEISRERNK